MLQILWQFSCQCGCNFETAHLTGRQGAGNNFSAHFLIIQQICLSKDTYNTNIKSIITVDIFATNAADMVTVPASVSVILRQFNLP